MPTRSPGFMPRACRAPARRATRSPNSRKLWRRWWNTVATRSGVAWIERRSARVMDMVAVLSFSVQWAAGGFGSAARRAPPAPAVRARRSFRWRTWAARRRSARCAAPCRPPCARGTRPAGWRCPRALPARSVTTALTVSPRRSSGDGDHAGFEDRRVRVQRRLDLGRPDLEARGVDHPLEPVAHEDVAFLVHAGEVAGAEEALAVDARRSSRRWPARWFQ